MESIFISETHYPRPSLRVHPLAGLSMTHAIMRQPASKNPYMVAGKEDAVVDEDETKVVGGLIGSIKDNIVEIVDSFQVPYGIENDNLGLDEKFLAKMVEFFTRTNRKEHLVGWYISAKNTNIYEHSNKINQIFAKYCFNPITEKRRNPIHLVAIAEQNAGLQFQGYIGKYLTDVFSMDYLSKSDKAKTVAVEKKIDSNTPTINQNPAAVAAEKTAAPKEDDTWTFMFERLNVETIISDSEAACLHHMIHSQKGGASFINDTIVSVVPKPDLSMSTSLVKLLEVIGNLESYVADVVSGRQTPDAEIGMALADIVTSMDAVSKESIEEVYRDRLHDMLMVSYLANLTKTQLQLADKIDSIL